MPNPLGYVAGRFIGHDGTTPATGDITFEAYTPTLIVDDRPHTAVADVKAPLIDGELGPLGLIPARYRVTFRLTGKTRSPFDIEVTTDHTEATPLDLTLAAPLLPSPSVKFVVNELVSRDAIAARDAARDAADSAEHASTATIAARGDARDAADAADAAREVATISATSASTSAAQAAADRDAIESLLPEFAWTLDPDDSDIVLFRVPEHWIDTDDTLVINMPVLGR